MGVKQGGGYHRGGGKLPTDGKQTITIKRSDYKRLREYAEWNEMKLVGAVTYIFDDFFYRGKVRRLRYGED
jgi:hypothetical protein